jgi:hypothetical protein
MQNNIDIPAVVAAVASTGVAVAQAIGHASTTAAQSVAPALEHAAYGAINLVVEGAELVKLFPSEGAKLYFMEIFTSTYPFFVQKIPAMLLAAMFSRVIQIHSKAQKQESLKQSTPEMFANENSLTPEKLQTTNADHVEPTATQVASSQNLETAETPSLLAGPCQAPELVSQNTHTMPRLESMKTNNSEEQNDVHGDTKRKRCIDEDSEFDESPSKKKNNVEKVSTYEFEHDDLKNTFVDDRENMPTQQVEVDPDVSKLHDCEANGPLEEEQEREAPTPSPAAEVEEESTSPPAAEPSALCPKATQQSIESHQQTSTETQGHDVIDEIDSSDEDEPTVFLRKRLQV